MQTSIVELDKKIKNIKLAIFDVGTVLTVEKICCADKHDENKVLAYVDFMTKCADCHGVAHEFCNLLLKHSS